VASSPGNEGIIYSISWAPGDLNYLAAASKDGVLIWNVIKGQIIKRFMEVSTVTESPGVQRVIPSLG